MLYKLFYTHNRSKHIGHFFKQNLFKDVHAVREEEATWTASPCIFAVPDLWNSSPTAHHNGAIHHSPKQPLCSAFRSKMSVQKEGTLYYRILIQEYKTHPLIFIVGTNIFLEYLQRYQILRFIYYKFYDIIFIIIQYTVYL